MSGPASVTGPGPGAAASLVDPTGPAPDSWFVAMVLPDTVRAAVRARLDDLPDRGESLAWTRPDGWHLTLAFLGRLAPGEPAEVVARLRGVVAATDRGAGVLALGGGVVLGRALALSVEAVAPWATPLQARVAAAVAGPDAVGRSDAGSEPRPWRPHVTLARARRGRPAATLVDAVTTRMGVAPTLAWVPDGLILVGSRHAAGPAHYVHEARLDLPVAAPDP